MQPVAGADPRRARHVRVATLLVLLLTTIALGVLLRPDRATLQTAPLPTGIAVNPVTGLVYVANMGAGTVAVLDGATERLVTTIAVGPAPTGIDVNPRTNQVYVALWRADEVVVIDGGSNRVTGRIAVGAFPWALQADPGTNHVYVANRGDGTVSAIDGATNTVAFTLVSGPEPAGLSLLPQRQLLFASNRGNGTVTVFDTARRLLVKILPIGGYAWGLVADDATAQVYVAIMGEARVARIDASTSPPAIATEIDRPGSVHAEASAPRAATYPTGLDPAGVAYSPVTRRVYVADRRSGSVTVIDTTRQRRLAAIDVGADPLAIATDPVRGRVYVANRVSGTVSVIDEGALRVVATIALTAPVPSH